MKKIRYDTMQIHKIKIFILDTSREQIRIYEELLIREHLSKIISSIVSTFNVNGEWQILFEDNISRVHEHENGKFFIEPTYMLNIVDNIKHAEVSAWKS